MLQRCEPLHITLSRSKFQIASSLNFAGCIVSSEGVQPDPACISFLPDFPVPRDQTGVRSFLGLCNQLALFLPNYQHHTVLLRQLTGKGSPFLWLPEQQIEFDKLKTILTSEMIVCHFDSSKEAVLLTFSALVTLWATLRSITLGISFSRSSDVARKG